MISSPRFGPLLIPEITKFGRTGSNPVRASLMQSVGVPSIALRRNFAHAERSMQCDRMAHRGLLAFRCNRVHFAEWVHAFFQRNEPLGMNAIVVRYQNDHACIFAKKRPTNKRCSD